MANQKIAVVTGSSSEIGLETAILLAKNGFKTLPQCEILTNLTQ